MKTCNQFNVMIWVTVSYIKWDVFVVIGQIHLVFGVLFYHTTGGRFIFTDINVLLVFKTPGHQVWGGTKWGNESLCCTSVSPKGNYCVPCSLAESLTLFVIYWIFSPADCPSKSLRLLLSLPFSAKSLSEEKKRYWWLNGGSMSAALTLLSLSIYLYLSTITKFNSSRKWD